MASYSFVRPIFVILRRRNFTRVGAGKTPDAKTMGRWGVAVGPEVVKQIHQRLVNLAQANGLAAGRRMRVDTTVVETNVHYPTDSSLLGDGVRVLIRTMKKIGKIAGETGAKLCDRSRSVKLRVLDIARAARSRAKQSRERLNRSYGKLLNATSRVVGQAKRFSEEIAGGTKRARNVLQQLALEGLRQELDAMVPLVKQVMKQTRARKRRTRAEYSARKFRTHVPPLQVPRVVSTPGRRSCRSRRSVRLDKTGVSYRLDPYYADGAPVGSWPHRPGRRIRRQDKCLPALNAMRWPNRKWSRLNTSRNVGPAFSLPLKLGLFSRANFGDWRRV
jgi:IS5 family transposase